MSKKKNRTAGTVPGSTGVEDAVFMGWQKTASGDDFALYTITAAIHPSAGSTVTGDTLNRLTLQVPGSALARRRGKKR